MNKRFRLAVFLAPAAFLVLSLEAQTGAGSVQGVVTDAAGAVVPNAAVTALRIDTKRQFETSTSGVGMYVFPALDPGVYLINVSSAGMQPWKGEVQLIAGQRATVDARLAVASESVKVTVVESITTVVDPTSATIGQVMEATRIQQLPLNGRNIASLVTLAVPGIEEGSGAGNRSTAGLPRAFGLKWGATEYVQDGASIMNRYWGQIHTRPPGIDTVQELRVETNNSSARFDRPATAILVTKSGSNQVHGALFETARNNGLAFARRRQDPSSAPPPLIRNEYGASVGGPIFIPRVYNGRDRSFFFAAFEANHVRQYSTANTALPTEAMRAGDFSGAVDRLGRRLTIYDPWTTDSRTYLRTPYPDNRIPVARRSPLAAHIYSVFPLPNLPGVNPLVASNHFWPQPDNRDGYTGTLRLDQRVSSRDQVFVRYTEGTDRRVAGNGFSGAPITLDRTANFYDQSYRDRTVAASWTRTISPTFFSETLVNYSFEDYDRTQGDRSRNWPAQLGLPNPFRAGGFPELRNTGFSGLDTGEQNNSQRNNLATWKLDENLTLVRGRHELQFGGRARLERLNLLPQLQFQQGITYFNSGATALFDPASGSALAAAPFTGFDGANFYLGAAGFYSVQLNRGYMNLSNREYAGYFQDNFKVNSRLTLNLGLRVESYPIPVERDNLLTAFDLENKAVVTGRPLDELYAMEATTPGIVKLYRDLGVRFQTPREAGLPEQSMISTNRFNFGLRLGAAWRLTTGSRPVVLRGGYSKFAFSIPLRYYEQQSRTNIPLSARFTIDYSQAANSPDGMNNYMLRAVPPHIAGVTTADLIDPNSPASVRPGAVTFNGFAPYQPTSRAEEWNFTLEREILPNTLARASWIGTRGTNLEQFYSANQAPSNYVWLATTGRPLPTGPLAGVLTRPWTTLPYGTINTYQRTGWSFNSSVVLQVERRFSGGTAFQAHYTMSNAIRLAGNGWYDDFAVDPHIFLPGSVPTDPERLNWFLHKRRDPEIPKHRMRWNWVADLPFGRGKFIGRNSGSILEHLIGGWQFAGSGNMVSRYFPLPANLWGPTSNVQVYGLSQPVDDCRSGRCFPGYLYYNGYITPGLINSERGVRGVPSNYTPAVTPLVTDRNSRYFDTNTAFVTMADGTAQAVAFDNGLNPFRNQFLQGPMLWTVNASLFKSIAIREGVRLRFNADFFNVLNQPGLNLPDAATGVISKQNSAQAPRQLQLTLRLIW